MGPISDSCPEPTRQFGRHCQLLLLYIQHTVNTPSKNMFTAIIKLSQLSAALRQQDDRDATSTSNKDVCASVVAINRFHIK